MMAVVAQLTLDIERDGQTRGHPDGEPQYVDGRVSPVTK